MKKLILLLCFGILPFVAACPPPKMLTIFNLPCFKPFEALYRVTCMVESSNNPNALNQKEMAYGIMQIRAIRLKDYNRRTRKHYKLKDCYNPKISKEIWLYYALKFNDSDYEGISKAWNGMGKSNEIYWGKIKKEISKIK